MLRWLTRLFSLFAGRGSAVRKPVVEEIEPRILYSADVNPLLWAGRDPSATAIVASVDAGAGEATVQTVEDQQQQQRRREIIFVDAAVPDAQTLVNGLLAARPQGTLIEVVQLNPSEDGLRQINAVLANERGLDAVHIVSHGNDAMLQLGSALVDSQALTQRSDEFTAWRDALGADADVLIYGCDVGAGDTGAAFIERLAQLTGADVAASTDATGAAALGGNWALEAQTGHIEAQLNAIARQLEQRWNGLLSLSPQGGETLVNTGSTTGSQVTTPWGGGNVAMDASGNYVVVFANNNVNSGDIYAQRYNASGVAQGAAILVNSTTANTQREPSVAMAADGRFVVSWSSLGQDAAGTYGIYARQFAADGTPAGAELQVNTSATGNQLYSKVGMDNAGNFVVVFADYNVNSGDVVAQRYNAAGVAQGGNFRVNTWLGDFQSYPDIDVHAASGNFIIVWESNLQDGSGNAVYGQRYSAAGVALGGEFQLHTATANMQESAKVAYAADGSFAVAWESAAGSSIDFIVRRFDANGVALTGEITVNTYTANTQRWGDLAFRDSNNLVVTWGSDVQDGSGYGIYAQQLDAATGAKLGAEVRVSTSTTNTQEYPSVAVSGSKAVIVWSGNGTVAGQTDSAGVFAQRFNVNGITVTPTSGLLTTEAGGTAQFSVVLDSAPTANVTVAVSSSDTTEGTVSTSLLTFTTGNWNIAQTVTVTGVNDVLADGVQAYTVVLGAATSSDANYNALNPLDVQVANTDNDITYNQITVDTVADTADGDTSSLTALAASRGADGLISLREAIIAANNTANGTSADRIAFNINGGGPHTINLVSVLPDITDAVTIDATTEPDFAGAPVVRLDGGNTLLDGFRLVAGSNGSSVAGFMTTRFTSNSFVVESSNNTIRGNYIGTDGVSALGGGGNGIYVAPTASGTQIGGTTFASRNIISGNVLTGITVNGNGTVIQGNYIGVGANGTTPIGNMGSNGGVLISSGASNTLVGGTAAGAGNLISNNARGVTVFNNTSLNNAILGNTIVSNTNLGIDLGTSGVTANDAGDGDTGPNGLQNFPVLTSANANSAGTTIVGSLNSNANTSYRIEFYTNRPTVADATNGEAERYLGFVTVTTDGSGNASVNTTLANVWVNSGDRVTATATVDLGGGNYGSTSEFAANVTASSTGIIVVDTTSDTVDGTTTSIINLGNARGADGRISMREAIDAANATTNGGGGTVPDKIVFAIPVSDANHYYYRDNSVAGSFASAVTTTLADAQVSDFDADYVAGSARSWYRISLSGNYLDVTQAVIIDGSTQAGYSAGNPVIEINAAGVTAGDANAIALTNGASTVRGLVINSAGDNAIEVDTNAGGSTIVGNYLGTDVSGTLARGNSTVGTWGAIAIKASGVVVGGTTVADRNLISGNAGYGIEIYNATATGALIQGNYIGTTVTGSGSLGNTSAGIMIRNGAATNTIGGIAAGQGNTIAFNGGDGIAITSTASGNAMRGNAIHSNSGLGIDLNDDGVTANDTNDTDAGPNALKNFAVLTAASTDGSTVRVSGTLHTVASLAHTIDFYAGPSADGSGYGEGAIYLGSTSVTTNASGNASFTNIAFTQAVPVGYVISAVTIDLASGNTSEFSAAIVATNAAPVLDSSKSPVLAAQNEDAGAPVGAVGTLVSALVDYVSPAGQVDNVTDTDVGAQLGIAVTAADTTNGSWWYSTDGGTNWNALGSPSAASARLLAADSDNRLYFQPNANYNGTLTNAITFRAWDRTSGSDGGSADTTTNGGTTAFSSTTDTASLSVAAINDAPAIATTGTTLAYTENGTATAIDSALTVSDVDSANLVSATITISAGFASGQDTLAFTNQNGISGSWNAGTGVLTLTGSATPANYQTALRGVTYVNTSDNPSTATRTVSFVVNDGSANSNASTRNITVTAANDAPTAADDVYSTNEDTPLVVGASTTGLLAWFSMSEGSGQTVASTGSAGSTGTLGSTTSVQSTDPTWTVGRVGSGLSFDGGDFVTTDSTALRTASAFTLSVWYQADTTTSTGHLLWQGYAGGNGYGSGGSTSPATSEMSLTMDGYQSGHESRILFSMGYDSNNSDSIFIVSANQFPDTSGWHHVAVTVADIGGGVMQASLYVDGVLQGTDTGTQIDRSAWQPLMIGSDIAGAREFDGRIDEVRIYANELTAAQVQTIAAGGVLANDTDPEGSLLQVNTTLVTGPANGTLSLNADGSFVYTPNANFSGADSFTYRANDGAANSNIATVNITVNPVNDAPTLGNGTLAAVNEDTASPAGATVAAIFSAQFADPDAGASLAGIAIVGNAANAGTEGVWQYSSNGGTDWFAVGTVADNNTALAVSSASLIRFVPVANYNGTPPALTVRGLDNSYAGGFSTTAGSQTRVSVNTASNGGTTAIAAATATLSTSIMAVNDAPVITSNGGGATAGVSVAENGSAVTTVTASDADLPGQTLSYSISGGADAALFSINPTTGALIFNSAPNFEAPSDAGADNVYDVTVQVSDGALTDTQAISITVSDVNEFAVGAIGDGNAAVNAVAENAGIGTAVGLTAVASDADASNNTITYTLDDSAGGRFAINAASGVVTVAAAIDREAAPSHAIVVRATSADGSFSTQGFTIGVGDVNEFAVGAPIDSNGAANSVAETAGLGSVVGVTAFAADADATTNAIVYTLDDSAGGRFAIDGASGVVTVAGALDYETSTSHAITVRATSADGSFATALFTIQVTDVSEAGVGVISDSNAAANAVSENAAVNTPVGITAAATDPDAGDTVTYSLADNAGGRFAINASTGVVVVNGALDAESAGSHNITVRADSSDGSFNTQVFTITVADQNEFAVSAVSDTNAAANAVAESAAIGTTVGITASASDADASNNTVTYTLDDNAGGRFAIDASSGVVTLASALDYESVTSHAIVVRATSADGSFSTAGFTVNVTAVNDNAPVITSNGGGAGAAINVAENTTAVTTVTASDADLPSQTLTYSIAGGADAARFAIDSATGALRFVSMPDFEAPSDANADNVYQVTVQVADGNGGFDTQAIAVTVSDVASTLRVTTTADAADSGITAGNAAHNAEWLNANRGADGAISLREAIIAANNTAGTDTITFDLAGAGVQTINVSAALPSITGTVIIDGWSEPDFAGTPVVELNGAAAGAGVDGLWFAAGSSGSTVRGLIINRFASDGLFIDGVSNIAVQASWIGLDASGSAAAGNGERGIFAINGSGHQITRNVISGNTYHGMLLGNVANSVIAGNLIGTDATGLADVNGAGFNPSGSGILLLGSSGNLIGGTTVGARNVISGNNHFGVEIGSGAQNNLVQGNYIGTDISGANALGNSTAGVGFWAAGTGNVVGGGQAGAGNVISGNAGGGVMVASASNGAVIQGNIIGLAADGDTLLGNGDAGVLVAGASVNTLIGTDANGANDAAERNVISGNGDGGVVIVGVGTSGTRVQGNHVGTNAAGTAARGNTFNGVAILGGATGNTIGGAVAGTGNLLSGNGNNGIAIADSGTSGNLVLGNVIGLDATRTTVIGNAHQGIWIGSGASGNTVGGAAAGAGNVIGGSSFAGIELNGAGTSNNTVAGNFIGTDAGGTANFGNGGNGVMLVSGASNNLIGGVAAGAGNLIANNGLAGVVVDSASSGNAILRNAIRDNVWMGIDLAYDGVTANDAGDGDGGANGLQNFPVLASANSIGGNTTITGTINSTPNTALRIELFSSPTGDASGHGEGAVYLGFVDVTTDASGNASFARLFSGVSVSAGHIVSATATVDLGSGNYGDTSEFSANVVATVDAAGVNITPIDATTGEGGAAGSFSVVLNTAPTANVTLLVTNSNNSEGVLSTNFLTFTSTNWNVAQTVTVTGVDDSIVDGDRAYTISVMPFSSADPAYSSLGVSTLGMVNTDDDTQSTIVVTTTSDAADGDTSSLYNLMRDRGADGQISLREAIIAANNSANGSGGADRIHFNIAAALVGGAHTINVLSALPTIDDTVIVAGESEPDFAVTPVVQLNGSAAGALTDGLVLTGNADGSTIRGLAINRFGQNAIVLVNADGVTIRDNHLGTDVSGSVGLGNGARGVLVIDSANGLIANNVISGNGHSGIAISGEAADGNVVRSNFIGTNLGGTAAIGNANAAVSIGNGADNNLIGSTLAGQRNVISGNANIGIAISGVGTTGNSVLGNHIGVDLAGTAALGNGASGISIESGASGNVIGAAGAGNVIAGNGAFGLNLEADGNVVEGNIFGLDGSASVALPNAWDAVFLWNGADNNRIGGTTAGSGNVISGAGRGVVVADGSGNAILGNTIRDNAGLGIDLGNDGVSANDAGDADTGANDLQNFPLLYEAVTDGSTITIRGAIDSAPNTTYRLEFFNNPLGSEDASGHGEGRTLLFAVEVTTDASGHADFSLTPMAASVAVGDRISATATVKLGANQYGSTSEFGANLAATSRNIAPAGSDGTINVTEDTTYTFTLADFGFSDSDGDALLRVWFDTLPAQGTLLWNGSAFAAGNFVTAGDIAAGLLTYQPAADSNGAGAANFTFRVQDDGGTTGGGSDTDTSANTIAIAISAVNDAPTGAPVVTGSATEDQTLGVDTTSIADADGVGALSFQWQRNGVDVLGATSATYTLGDADVGTTIRVVVSYTDGDGTVESLTSAGTGPVANVNDAPVLSAANNPAPIDEDALANPGTLVSALIAGGIADADSGAVTGIAVIAVDNANGAWEYTTDGGANWLAFGSPSTFNARLLAADANTRLRFVPAADYDGSANIVFRAWDQTSGSAGGTADTGVNGGVTAFSVNAALVTQTINPVNDAPVVTSGGGGANAALAVAENQTAVATVTSSDVDGGTPAYTIVGGADAALFAIDSATGELTFIAAPNFEAPADAGADNVYDVTVRVVDGNGGVDTQAIAVTVTNANEAPVITSNGGAAVANLSIAENQRAVTVVTSADVDGAAPSYAIVGGADAARFTIDASSGALNFASAPNFEAPADADLNNVYELIVGVADGNGGAATQTIAVAVTGVNEAPGNIAPASLALTENAAAGTVVAVVTASDPDAGDLFTFTLVNDGGGRFIVDPASGRLLVAPGAVLDFETQPTHTLVLRVTDAQGLRTEQTIVVTLSDAYEPLTGVVLPDVTPPPPPPAPAPSPAPVALAPVAAAPTVVADDRERGDGRGSAPAGSALPGLLGDALVGNVQPQAADSVASSQRGRGVRDGAPAVVATVSFAFDVAGTGGWSDGAFDGLLSKVTESAMQRMGFSSLRGSSVGIDTSDDALVGVARGTAQSALVMMQDPVRVASATLTAGFVWWLTRSGGLLTSILMGIPAWRHVDLLPVLAPRRGDEEDDDGLGTDSQDDDTQADDGRDSAVDEIFSNTSRQFGESRYLS